MFERDALLRAILRDPDDDTVRLVYADWLTENAGTMTCPACKPHDDAKNWIPGHTPNPYSRPYWQPCARCKATTVVPDGRTEHAAYIRQQITKSKLARDRIRNETLRKKAHALGYAWAEEWLYMDAQGLHRRGFIGEVTTVMPRFLEMAKEWFSTHPIIEVKFEDMDSDYAGIEASAGWHKMGSSPVITNDADDIPVVLWPYLIAVDQGRADGMDEPCRWIWYNSDDEANEALSRACVAYGRKLAGLKERKYP